MTKLSLLALVLLVPAASFASKHDKDHEDAFMPGAAGESKIASGVRHQLLMLPYYGVFDDLAFRVDGSNVTLLGATPNPVLKSDAEKAAKKVEGVTHVQNEIELLPVSPMDDDIRRGEYRAIYGDPSLATLYGFRSIPPIHIIVKNGSVTLEGAVASEMDKNLISIRANTVPGVFSVMNDLTVEKH